MSARPPSPRKLAQHSLRPPPLITALITALIMVSLTALGALIGCDDQEPSRCAQDSDCREGYRCDLKIYVGECVQIQDVVSCGESLCFYPQERCVEERCVEASSLGDMEPPLGGRGLEGGGSAGASPAGVERGGVSSGVESAGMSAGGVEGGRGGEGGAEPLRALSVEWLTPEDNATLSLAETYSVSGLVRYDGALVTAAQSVSVSISWLSALEGTPQAEPLVARVGDEGRFEAELELPPGVITLIAEVEAFGQTQQAYRQLTLDDLVRAQGAELTWAGRPYRGLGVDLPQLLPWLAGRQREERSQALEQLWAELRHHKVRYIRTFIGWTRGPAATLSGPQSFNPDGVALLDELIESATRGGLKLIFVLSDPSRRLVGFEDYVRWAGVMNPSAEDEARAYRVGLTREQLLSAMGLFPARQNALTGRFYRDEPAILGWELLNSPSWLNLSAEDRAQVTTFLMSATTLLQDSAPQQLLWTGELGFDSNPTPYGAYATELERLSASGLLTGLFGGRWSEHLRSLSPKVNSVALDVLSARVVSPSQWSAFGSAWLRGHALASLGAEVVRPLSVTYARLPRAGVDPNAQRTTLIAWASEAYSQGYSLFTVSEFTLPGEEREGDELWELGAPDSASLLEALSAIWSQD